LNDREILEPHPFNSTFGVGQISHVRLREARFSSLAIKLSTAEEPAGIKVDSELLTNPIRLPIR
jgi:hypothetical protein